MRRASSRERGQYLRCPRHGRSKASASLGNKDTAIPTDHAARCDPYSRHQARFPRAHRGNRSDNAAGGCGAPHAMCRNQGNRRAWAIARRIAAWRGADRPRATIRCGRKHRYSAASSSRRHNSPNLAAAPAGPAGSVRPKPCAGFRPRFQASPPSRARAEVSRHAAGDRRRSRGPEAR